MTNSELSSYVLCNFMFTQFCVCVCVAMRLMSSIVSVAAEVTAQALMTRRRCELEKNKPAEHRAIDRIEELEGSYREVKHRHILLI